MRLMQQQFLWFVVLVSMTGFAPAAQAFDLSDFFKLPLAGYAEEPLPAGLECKGQNGKPLSLMNETVLNWKSSTPDQYQNRALIHGTISKVFPYKNKHVHFGIFMDSDGSADLEVIYNDDFGELPALNVGMKVVACGDYITVGPRAAKPSPLGAIIHWVHYNPGDRDGGKHPHGFLVINNKPYGVAVNTRGR